MTDMAPAKKKPESERMKAVPLRMKPADYQALLEWCQANDREFGAWARDTLISKMRREQKKARNAG